jgi:hypothetical protein
MKETLLNLWEMLDLVVGVGFVLACLWGFPPSRDEQPYYWEMDAD